jgi:hypothetical protein
MTTLVTPPARACATAPERAALETTPHTASRRAWTRWAGWLGLATAICVAIAAQWAFDALPSQDLPAHAGLIALRHRFADSPFEQRYFVLAETLGPYSLFRFLGERVAAARDGLTAVRVLGSLPLVATPLALLFARRRLFADRTPTHAYFGVALSFGLMTLLGFSSYLLGVAVFLVTLTLWLELLASADESPRAPTALSRELAAGSAALILFVAHGHAFALFLLCAVVAAVTTGRRGARLLRLRALVPAVALAAWVGWSTRAGTVPRGSALVSPVPVPVWGDLGDKLGLLVTPTLSTRTGIDVGAAVVVWSITLACTAFTLPSLRGRRGENASSDVLHSRALLACALAVTILFFFLPHAIGWFGFVDGRLLPIVLHLALLGMREEALPRPLARVVPVTAFGLAATMSGLALAATYAFQAEAAGFREVLGRVPERSRLLNLPLDPNSEVFTAHPFIHYDKLVLVDRPAVVSDVWFHQGSALYPTADNPALRLPSSYSESDLRVIDWPSYHLEDWDYVLVRTRPSAASPHTPSRLELVEHRGGWWLFRRK